MALPAQSQKTAQIGGFFLGVSKGGIAPFRPVSFSSLRDEVKLWYEKLLTGHSLP